MEDTELRIHVAAFLLLAVFYVADASGNPGFDPIQPVVLLALGIAYAFVLVGSLLAHLQSNQ